MKVSEIIKKLKKAGCYITDHGREHDERKTKRRKPMKYVYPAIFTEENGAYSVLFPDLEGCYTCGDDLKDAFEMAEDVLAFTLYHYETKGLPIPEPSAVSSIKVQENEFINYVLADTLEYQKMHNNKAIKKTLTIPEWLNELATENNVNFSQVLQNALKEQLHVV